MYFVCNPNENNMIIRGKTSCPFPKIKIKERGYGVDIEKTIIFNNN
jgi:hypothetical protein